MTGRGHKACVLLPHKTYRPNPAKTTRCARLGRVVAGKGSHLYTLFPIKEITGLAIDKDAAGPDRLCFRVRASNKKALRDEFDMTKAAAKTLRNPFVVTSEQLDFSAAAAHMKHEWLRLNVYRPPQP